MLKLLVLLFSAGKLGKVAITGLTMIISVFAYTLVFGVWYAVGLVGLIFVHEMGHFMAARQRGLAVGAPTFIPFVGAWVQLKTLPHDVETEAYVALAGPVAGTLVSIACYVLARSWHSDLLLALSYAGFFINLFNLIPLAPFDGGRITSIVSPRVWLLGVPILIALFVWRPSPMLLLVALLAAPHVWKAVKFDRRDPANAVYYDVPARTRILYGIVYLALACYLAVMTGDVHDMLQSARPSATEETL